MKYKSIIAYILITFSTEIFANSCTVDGCADNSCATSSQYGVGNCQLCDNGQGGCSCLPKGDACPPLPQPF